MMAKIKDRISIVSLAKHLGLHVNNSGFMNSIYKSEKTPSLRLYPETNSYFCFATNQGGDVIKFYRDYRKIDFVAAVKELSEILKLKTELNTNNYKVNSQKQNLNFKRITMLSSERDYFNEQAGKYEHDAGLEKWKAEQFALQDLKNLRRDLCCEVYSVLYESHIISDIALGYLTSNQRKLNEETIKRFRLFSLDKNSKNFLLESFTTYELIVSGLFNANCRFVFQNHDLIIPYIENGRIVYLRARYIEKPAISTQRYSIGKYCSLYNPFKDLTSKRFYNIDTLKICSSKKIIITEGEFDCMIVEQHGYNAIGIPGVSSFPTDKVKLLNEFEIYLAFDSDKAGQKAVQDYSKLFDRKVYQLRLKGAKDLTEAL